MARNYRPDVSGESRPQMNGIVVQLLNKLFDQRGTQKNKNGVVDIGPSALLTGERFFSAKMKNNQGYQPSLC